MVPKIHFSQYDCLLSRHLKKPPLLKHVHLFHIEKCILCKFSQYDHSRNKPCPCFWISKQAKPAEDTNTAAIGGVSDDAYVNMMMGQPIERRNMFGIAVPTRLFSKKMNRPPTTNEAYAKWVKESAVQTIKFTLSFGRHLECERILVSRAVNNMLTGWPIAHPVNYFAHPVNHPCPLPKNTHPVNKSGQDKKKYK